MKKSLFGWLAFASMLVATGCSNDEVVNDYSPENAIQFGTYVGRDAQARATVIDDTKLGTDGFGVYAYYTGTTEWKDYALKSTPNFMNNTKVTKSGDKWVYSPIKYWPNNEGDKVSFFAYAPWQENYNANIKLNDYFASLDFTVNNDVKEQDDLLWNATEHINETKQSIEGTIDFNFKHALARIGFTVQAAVDQIAAGGTIAEGTTITLNKIVLGTNENGFYSTGTLDLTATTATWSAQAGEQAFTLTAENFIEESNVLNNTKNTQAKLMDTTVEGEDDFLMVIPEKMTNLQVYIEYTVATVSTENNDNSTIENKITKTIDIIDFVAGNAYTLNLVLGMTSVKITADMEEWDEQEAVKVDLPINTTTTATPEV